MTRRSQVCKVQHVRKLEYKIVLLPHCHAVTPVRNKTNRDDPRLAIALDRQRHAERLRDRGHHRERRLFSQRQKSNDVHHRPPPPVSPLCTRHRTSESIIGMMYAYNPAWVRHACNASQLCTPAPQAIIAATALRRATARSRRQYRKGGGARVQPLACGVAGIWLAGEAMGATAASGGVGIECWEGREWWLLCDGVVDTLYKTPLHAS